MAKTIYQALFGPAMTPETTSGRQTITEADAQERNDNFWALLLKEESFSNSRFDLSQST
jgi:hypothetical protein